VIFDTYTCQTPNLTEVEEQLKGMIQKKRKKKKVEEVYLSNNIRMK